MRFLFFFSFTFLFSNLSPNLALAKKITYKLCLQLTEEINSTLPMTVNQNAILISSYCSGKANSPSLHYIYNTQFDELGPGEYKRMQNVYCSSQKTKMLLAVLESVHLHYFSPDGTEFAVIKISEVDCK
jgi:hypothetical protein